MKTLSVLLLVLFSMSANASQVVTISSNGKVVRSPLAYSEVESKVQSAVKAYKAFDKNIGEISSWSCDVALEAQANAMPAITKCNVVLTLPRDWDYYGSFKLDLGFDRVSGTVTSLKYEWSKDNI